MGDGDDHREYDREYTKQVRHGTRIRMGYATDRGTITRFVVQLEHTIDGEWKVVVRFDHDPDAEHGHDVTEEGVHVDIYRDDEKRAVETMFPPMRPGPALTFAEEHLSMHHERYVERFEKWHRMDRTSE